MRSVVLPLILGAIAVALIHFAYPAAAAAGCPSCYGFTEVEDGLYVERGMTPDRREAAKATVAAARARVRAFYGDLRSGPRILLCGTDACYRPLGGGSRGIALLDRALILSPRGADVVIAAHELAHAELHRRIGLVATLSRSVPQWFDEGLAVVVSDDPRYLATGPDRCRAEPGGDMPASRAAWIETADSAGLYARAACKVSRWLDAHGGSAGLLRLVAGGSFRDLAPITGS
ncbi:hypothetical protein [Methylobacterium goesingense]|uniref:Peptidase M48 domain-containing protein n=1 Tax=Methylobacterium goesingense TaxID=243690 RepID=A0ABV2LAR9_9HYPH|nr:hypothetical protein [Methylobacterium goesingense]GJD72247.1 hypothetical protein CFIICLFH_0460 [Methylobacterium goesingense]